MKIEMLIVDGYRRQIL